MAPRDKQEFPSKAQRRIAEESGPIQIQPRDGTNGKQSTAEQSAERKRTARIPADGVTGLPRYDLDRLDLPVAEIVIRGADGERKVVQVHRLSIDSKKEIALRTHEAKEEVDVDGAQQRLFDAFRAAVRQCVRGATQEELGALNEELVGRILVIAEGLETDTPIVGDAKEAEHHVRTRKARR